ncbi:SDR family oxidoreductase [Pseudonocardia sp. KRD291]|uniref:SDR family oxidoreductase n=1 Tax=Pseudonocardia sp. KRD291 TaxID=2792007 RepID=UPI001C49F5D9|nr:SDR family oxidoreductase [Pseudonocardia sp. KRD291]MBW0102694.1 SDR family oxidoreductase [Pseudonocardia sp. KRD291]
MRVFVTGASGHIGSAVVPELLSGGHEVLGLARSDSSAAAVEALGAEARRGDLTDLDGLRAAAAEADGVVHLAFDHEAMRAGDLAGAADGDLVVVRALGEAMAGTGKPFVGIGLGADRLEAVAGHPRIAVAEALAALSESGVRSVLVGVPQVVHSDLDRSGFVPTLVDIARRTGVSGYVDDGANRWPAVHTLDLARLFRLALEQAPAGSQLPAAAEDGIRIREIAEAIGRGLDLPVTGIAAAQAEEHFGPFGAFILSLDNPMSGDSTRRLLDWAPEHPGLIADIEKGHYLAA